jgi:hypothetical protein
MTDIQLYTKLSSLPFNLKMEVVDFIDFVKHKSQIQTVKNNKRIAGKAKGLISLKDNFDAPMDIFNEYQ